MRRMWKSPVYCDLLDMVTSNNRCLYRILNKITAKDFKDLMDVGQKVNDYIKLLKWLVCLHHVLILDESQTLANSIECYRIPGKIQKDKSQKTSDRGLKSLFLDKIAKPYLHFLQKRSIRKQSDSDNMLQDCFELINLINAGCSFSSQFHKIGRYYQQQYPFLIDLNVVLARDLKGHYNELADCFHTLWTSQSQFGQDVKTILNNLLMQIEKLNEDANALFLNVYNYRWLQEHQPNWIRLEGTTPKKQKSLSTKGSSEKSLGQLCCIMNSPINQLYEGEVSEFDF